MYRISKWNNMEFHFQQARLAANKPILLQITAMNDGQMQTNQWAQPHWLEGPREWTKSGEFRRGANIWRLCGGKWVWHFDDFTPKAVSVKAATVIG